MTRSDDEEPASTLSGVFFPEDDPSGFIVRSEPHPDFIRADTRYEILEEIGRGGVGVVYRARDWELNRLVAIKILKSGVPIDSEIALRFVNEARIMGRLQHPCIPHVYDSGQCHDGRPFHAMMLIQGQTLFSMMRSQRLNRYRQAQLLNIFARLSQAVAYTHLNDVVHLDLKPGNVMVGEFGEVHLMDWGLARFEDEDSAVVRLVDEGGPKVRGTLEYMAPEQARGESLDERTDVFNLGAMLYEILTGHTIYPGDTKMDKHRQAACNELGWAIEQLEACGAHRPLMRLTKNCLEVEPENRPVNAAVIAAEMWSYQASTLERVQSDMTRFFELSLDLFCIAGFDGYFRRINANFSRVLGYREAELLSQPFVSFVHPDDLKKTLQAMECLSEGQPVVRFRNRYRAIDGEYFEFEWMAKSVPAENTVFAVARNLAEPGVDCDRDSWID